MRKSKIKSNNNCKHCNKYLRRADWYYRDNNYFCNKKHYKLYKEQLAKERAEKRR